MAPEVADRQHGRPGRRDDRAGLVRRARERLLAEHVDATLEQLRRELGVQVVGHRHDRRVELQPFVGRGAARPDPRRERPRALQLGIDEPDFRRRGQLRKRWQMEVLGHGPAADHPEPHRRSRR